MLCRFAYVDNPCALEPESSSAHLSQRATYANHDPSLANFMMSNNEPKLNNPYSAGN
jgi:hypothetical protein